MSCAASENQSITLSETADNSTNSGDGGAYYPNSSGNDDVCEEDEDGNCDDAVNNDEAIQIATTALDFDVNEVYGIECETILIPGGLSYAAEIDKSNTDEVGGVYQFSLLDGSGDYSQERVEGTGEVSICYVRDEIGAHTGQIKLVLNADSTTSSAYAYVITVTGQTVSAFFTITNPTDGQIISSAANEGVDDSEGDYLITAAGSINTGLISILENGSETDIIIDADGVKYRANFDASGNISKTIGVPQTPGVYDVVFSAETTRDYTIEKSVTVVVATSPDLLIEVRDNSGNEVGTSTPTDAVELIVGINVSNLAVSGSSETSMPVELTDILMNGEELHEDIDIYYGKEGLCEDEEGSAYTGFDEETTLCVPLNRITELQQGMNFITAKAKNSLGETSAEFTLIIDNDKPIVTMYAPRENQLYDPVSDATTFTIYGRVQNFSAYDLDSVPDLVSADDLGSYCQPESENDDNCPSSSVKLWFNVSTDDSNLPIYIYPDLSDYDAESLQELYTSLSEAEDTAGQCRTDTDGVLSCNIPEAFFKINLTIPSVDHHATLNGFGPNIIQVQAESVSGHRTIEVTTFVMGEIKEHSYTNNTFGDSKYLSNSDLTTYLGSPNETCSASSTNCVTRAPAMLNLSSGIFNRNSEEGAKVIRAVEYILNKELNFADLANGWPLPETDDGATDLLADFREQYRESTGDEFDFVWNLSEAWQRKFIWQGLHSTSMAAKDLALLHMRIYRMQTGTLDWTDCNAEDIQTNGSCYFENSGDQMDRTEGFDVAKDACENEITTAFVPLKDLYPIAEAFSGVTSTIPYEGEWPQIAGFDTGFNDFTEGKWHVDELTLKDNGYIDADLCLIPEDADIETCSDDVSESELPAFWGHFISYNLIKGGLLQGAGIDDPTMPLVWALGKVRLKLIDIIKISHKTLSDGTWTNYININLSPGLSDAGGYFPSNTSDAVDINIVNMSENHENNSIILEPFANCDNYYEALYKSYRNKHSEEGHDIPAYTDDFLPYGCNPDHENDMVNYPFLLDQTSDTGQELLRQVEDMRFFLQTIWQGVTDTFKKQVGCMDTELINPILNESAFPYPGWVSETDQISTEFEWEDYTFGVNVSQSDLNVSNNGISVRIPLEAEVSGVMSQLILGAIQYIETGEMGRRTSFNMTAYQQANIKGFTTRTLSNSGLTSYPLTSENPSESAFASVSLNVEEVINSVAYMIFKKGPLSLLEYFEVEELEANNNWSIGIDKVVLGRFDICDLAGILPTDFSPTLWFTSISSSLTDEAALHLDIILDKDYPPMLFMSSLDDQIREEEQGLVSATQINLGLTNVQIAVKELIGSLDDDDEVVANVYEDPKDQPELMRVRVDGVLSMKAVYYNDSRKLYVYLDTYANQNLHVSVPTGHGGVSYDDVNTVTDVLGGVLGPLIDKFGREFTSNLEEADPTFIVTLDGGANGSLSVVGLNDAEFELNAEGGENAECGDNIPYYYDEYLELESNDDGDSGDGSDGGADTGDSDDDSDGDAPLPTDFTLSPEIIEPMFDYCDVMWSMRMVENDDGELERIDNPIGEALCDFGIRDLTLTPTIIFDNEQGYIHLSADAAVELYDWVP